MPNVFYIQIVEQIVKKRFESAVSDFSIILVVNLHELVKYNNNGFGKKMTRT